MKHCYDVLEILTNPIYHRDDIFAPGQYKGHIASSCYKILEKSNLLLEVDLGSYKCGEFEHVNRFNPCQHYIDKLKKVQTFLKTLENETITLQNVTNIQPMSLVKFLQLDDMNMILKYKGEYVGFNIYHMPKYIGFNTQSFDNFSTIIPIKFPGHGTVYAKLNSLYISEPQEADKRLIEIEGDMVIIEIR